MASKISMSHLCRRNINCACQPLIKSNLSLLLADNNPTVLTSKVLYQTIALYCASPEIHLPFPTFLHWIQIELYLQHYTEAQAYIKAYLSAGNLEGGELPMKKEEYQELMEVLVFNCIYVSKGYEEAKECIIRDKELDQLVKTAFMRRLNEVDGKPLEIVKETVTNSIKLKSALKSFLVKHRWKLLSIAGCLVLITLLKTKLINKVN